MTITLTLKTQIRLDSLDRRLSNRELRVLGQVYVFFHDRRGSRCGRDTEFRVCRWIQRTACGESKTSSNATKRRSHKNCQSSQRIFVQKEVQKNDQRIERQGFSTESQQSELQRTNQKRATRETRMVRSFEQYTRSTCCVVVDCGERDMCGSRNGGICT